MSRRVLGAIIAGGASSRYGAPKALAKVGDTRVVDRVAAALRLALAVPPGEPGTVVAIVNDAELATAIALPHRPDELRGVGALAGVHAALVWARERDCAGVLAAACDMPFLDAGLLREILTHTQGMDAVLPESEGRRGVEPLCAWYGVACIDAIEAATARGDNRMIGFHDVIRVARVPLDRVRAFGDPGVMFQNLNTPADRDEVERWLSRGAAP